MRVSGIAKASQKVIGRISLRHLPVVVKESAYESYSPKQLSYYSRDAMGKYLLEDSSSLKTLTIPDSLRNDILQGRIDLSKGYQDFKGHKLDRNVSKIYDMLYAVQKKETENESLKKWYRFYTSRGVLVDIASMVGVQQDFETRIAMIGDQIVMCSDNYRDDTFYNEYHQKSSFCGWKFESLMTGGGVVENTTNFKSLISGKIGDHGILFSSEADACIDVADASNLTNYVELKTYVRGGNARTRQQKIYKAAMQCAFAKTPWLINGDRDKNFKLIGIDKIDISQYAQKTNIMSKSFRWLELVLNWLSTTIEEHAKGGTAAWVLKHNSRHGVLELVQFNDDENVSFIRSCTIGDEFAAFRAST